MCSATSLAELISIRDGLSNVIFPMVPVVSARMTTCVI